MKNLPALFSAVILVLLSGSLGRAQTVFGEYATHDGLRRLEIGKALAQMPETGTKPEDFVPAHWTITDRVEGDLNADGVKDWVFTMMLDERDTKYLESLAKPGGGDMWIDKTFIIVIVDSRGDRKMHFSAVNYNLYGDADAPARNGDARDEFTLAIKKNVLEVKLSYGGSLRTDVKFLFRDGGLIGFEVENSCVTLTENCSKSRLSENYLTGTRIETSYKITADKINGADKTTKIPPVKVDFMNARLNYANDKGGPQPF